MLESNGKMINMNGQEITCTTQECRTWDVLQQDIDTGYSSSTTDWKWDSANIRGTDASPLPYTINPIIFELSTTIPTTITISAGEAGVQLDKIMLIPEQYACPTNQY